MENLLIVGAGGFGRVVLEHASKQYICSFIDDGYEVGDVIDDVKVVGHVSDLKVLFNKYNKLIVAIGNNAIREIIYEKAKGIGYSFPNIIHPSAYISRHATIGNGSIILNYAVIQNGAVAGNGLILNPGAELHHDSIVGNNVLIYTNSVIRSLTQIGDRVKIGSTVTVSTGAVIEDDMEIADGNVFSS